MTRIKNIGGFPISSVQQILKKFNLRKKDIDYIAIATKRIVHTNLFNVPVSFSVSDYLKKCTRNIIIQHCTKKKKKFLRFLKISNLLQMIFYPMKKIPFVTTSEISTNKINDLEN